MIPPTFIYRYDFRDRGYGNVEIAIFDPAHGLARFGYEARVTIFQRAARVGEFRLETAVEIGSPSIVVGIEDARLKAAVYAKAIAVAERAQNVIDANVGDTVIFNAAALMLPAENVEVDEFDREIERG